MEAESVAQENFAPIPTVNGNPSFATYDPLAETQANPAIVLLFLNGKQVMTLHGSLAKFPFEGKPQCHIITKIKETGDITVSAGCMLSRLRTGINNNDFTCAVSYVELSNLFVRLEVTTVRI